MRGLLITSVLLGLIGVLGIFVAPAVGFTLALFGFGLFCLWILLVAIKSAKIQKENQN